LKGGVTKSLTHLPESITTPNSFTVYTASTTPVLSGADSGLAAINPVASQALFHGDMECTKTHSSTVDNPISGSSIANANLQLNNAYAQSLKAPSKNI